MRCPQCSSTHMHRSRDRRERRLRFFLPVHFYRSQACNRRVLRVTPRAVGEVLARWALLGLGGVVAWRGFRGLFSALLRY
jgi:hypothetical protein